MRIVFLCGTKQPRKMKQQQQQKSHSFAEVAA